ncbi:MAG TPA: helix-hairpin-helix domain-containing protein [Longimicrobiales bacterium]|nr:helix-hairpin-helix domain-containing protein [Longimicrobiales bacterium]
MDRHAVALVLQEIASLLQTEPANRFRARAFRAAARAVEGVEEDLPALVASGALHDVPGIGPATARIIEELVVTGESSYLATLQERGPATLQALLRVPGLGPRKIGLLHSELGITDLDSLEAAARSGHIARLRGFGEKTQQAILAGVPFARSVAGRRTYLHAAEAAHRLAGFIATLPGVLSVSVAGELRRRLETADRIVIVAAVQDGGLEAALAGSPGLAWTRAEGAFHARLADGIPVSVQAVTPAGFGAALLLATGSATHVAAVRRSAGEAGLRLETHGLFRDDEQVPTPAEDAVYEALDMQPVPPELREHGDEVALALARRLPRLVEPDDLRGCFHCHTTYSDGVATLEEMAEGALALGWRYLGIADHSRSAGYAGGLSVAQVRRQHAEIDAWNRRRGDELHIFRGVEADIMQDGRLDYAAQGDDAVLAAMDYVVGSVHSRFKLDRKGMTRRMVTAVSDRRLTFLGHATGRLLLMRDGYDVDLDAVIRTAAEYGAAIEINADPRRLDMSWQHWPLAGELGVRTAINPDAHSVDGMRNVEFGVNVARKAWLTADDVINTWELADVQQYFEERKRGGQG